jgi:hypothetical protein
MTPGRAPDGTGNSERRKPRREPALLFQELVSFDCGQTKDSFLRSLQCTADFEARASAEFGVTRIAGLDEVERGNLIGPTVAAAVILPIDLRETLQGNLRDSKLISPQKRAAGRRDQALRYCVECGRSFKLKSCRSLTAATCRSNNFKFQWNRYHYGVETIPQNKRAHFARPQYRSFGTVCASPNC